MIYKDFQGLKLSALGLGTMRLPVVEGKDSQIAEEEAIAMYDYALANGINYIDTAWGYHSGNSELVTGKALSRHPRESYYLATKFPGYDVSNFPKVKEIFEEQLKKLQVEYFDFYLFHNINEQNIDYYLDDEKYGVYTYLMEQKKNGRIKHIGFSAHGNADCIKRFLDAYGKDMEFGQLQLNWLDWDLQEAGKKAALLTEWNIPVWVMEPLRGGKLVNLSDEFTERLRKIRPNETNVGMSFRFLQAHPEIKVVLSGMSNMEQLKDNIRIYETDEPLTEDEQKELAVVAKDMLKPGTLPCTACHYCVSHCPMELDIPELINRYNDHKFSGGGWLTPMYVSSLPDDKKPSACLACRSCEAVCPQNIKISEMMSDFVEILKK